MTFRSPLQPKLFYVCVWIQACCWSRHHFYSTERISMEIKRLTKVATAWCGKQVRKIVNEAKPSPTFHPAGRELTAKAVSSSQGFQLGLGFWLGLYLLLDDKILASITVDLVIVCWWSLQSSNLGFSTVICPAYDHLTLVLCVLPAWFSLNVDGLEIVACLPENLFLHCILLYPWFVQTLAMETSPWILLTTGAYKSLAGMVRPTAWPRVTAHVSWPLWMPLSPLGIWSLRSFNLGIAFSLFIID